MPRKYIAAAMPLLSCCVLMLLPGSALAHSFGRAYSLPVPFWMYLYGAAAALVVSFVIIGYFMSRPNVAAGYPTLDLSRWAPFRAVLSRPVLESLRVVSLLLLVFTILTGLIGVNNSYKNFNMTFFWIIFILGFTYLTSLIGNAYAFINPWKAVTQWVELVWKDGFSGRFNYPRRLGYFPALVLYIAFIWLELYGRSKPFSLSVTLLCYTALNFAGAWLWGRAAWFRYCEFLSVFLRLTAMAAPIEYAPAAQAGERGRLKLRPPFIGLLRERADSFSLLLFVLFMLSSTAFDGFRETMPWVKFFWRDIYQALTPIFGTNIVQTFPTFKKIYAVYNALGLILSPIFYLAIYLALIWLAKLLTRSAMSVRQLALDFAFSLIPIAFVYNITHYYTLIVTQGQQIWRLMSDPFGFGWDLFGSAKWVPKTQVLDAGFVWHSQVALILLGHIVSVYLAHIVALKVFPTHRKALISQLPMLILMVAYTAIGLWILSQPISQGQVMMPR